MAKRRQVVLMRGPKAGGSRAAPAEPGALEPLGTIREVTAALAPYNTAPDGSNRTGATEFLYGPGMVVELPLANPEVKQALVSMTEEEMALPVLMKLCKALGWRMVDLETGRAFG